MYFWYVVVLYPRDTIENHWNRRLAEAAITVYEGTKMRDKYIELLDGYWDQTEKLTLDELNFMEKNRQFTCEESDDQQTSYPLLGDDIYVRDKKTGRIGFLYGIAKPKWVVMFYDQHGRPEPDEFYGKDEIEIAKVNSIKTSQLKAFIRGELSAMEITQTIPVLPEEVERDEVPYELSVEDLLVGINHFINQPKMEAFSWIDALARIWDLIPVHENEVQDDSPKVTEKDILNRANMYIGDLRMSYEVSDPIEYYQEDFRSLQDLINRWVVSGGKDYPEYMVDEG